MGLQLPGELASLLGMLGYTWPEADEEKLFQMGRDWLDFAADFGGAAQDADGHAGQVWAMNEGEAIKAFQQAWNEPDSPVPALQDGQVAANIMGAGLMVCGMIVLTLKIAVIIQLIQLAIQIAMAIAQAVPTFGASLVQIPIFKMITGLLIDMAISMALEAILGG
ncbi:hypothetical protein SAMN04489712_11240 [Thermomonospora echinospora]|uniref:Outer membrane channel protein CpnT-like N-terminal domain-containing protein n=1 Tax=Thermomonospora echinospora TaxID=1992 RepID=A0A1H6CYS2_9ACTN|nr:hypothetical protein [Thermomonospora echinospora]SEG78172.1 hypothetical protein SAMN04489712_11240 [Thermomonospora echinospora]